MPSLSSTISAQSDEDLVDNFRFMSEKEVDQIKVTDLRNRIRAIESLRTLHNGVPKKGMVEVYMKWQRRMQFFQAEKAKLACKATPKSQSTMHREPNTIIKRYGEPLKKEEEKKFKPDSP